MDSDESSLLRKHPDDFGGVADLIKVADHVDRAVGLRTADPHTDWQRLFLHRAQRRVRLDATFSLEGRFWEVPAHLRGRLIEVRFDPFAWQRVEIWIQDRYLGLAKPCDKQLNSKTYSKDYERPQ